MEFDFTEIPMRDRYKLMVATIVPRPIAWVVTQSAEGVVNAAPYSFFNAVSSEPPLLCVSIDAREDGTRKDTAVNIRQSGQFVVNLVSDALGRAMVVTAIDFEPGVSELAEARLSTAASIRVTPPRIADSPVAFECETYQTIELPGGRDLVLGRVVFMHVSDGAMLDVARRHVDTPALDLIGRLHGAGWYGRTRDRVEIPRIALEDWR